MCAHTLATLPIIAAVAFWGQVEGCHDYPNDYHVPSLEECGVNGLCKPGKCRRRGSNMLVEEGVSATAAVTSQHHTMYTPVP